MCLIWDNFVVAIGHVECILLGRMNLVLKIQLVWSNVFLRYISLNTHCSWWIKGSSLIDIGVVAIWTRSVNFRLAWETWSWVRQSSSMTSGFLVSLNETTSTVGKIEKVFENRIFSELNFTFIVLGFTFVLTWVTVQSLRSRERPDFFFLWTAFLGSSFSSFFRLALLRLTLGILKANFELKKRIRIFIYGRNVFFGLTGVLGWQLKTLWNFFMTWWWPHLVIVHCSILVCKLAATSNSLMEEVYARTHSIFQNVL